MKQQLYTIYLKQDLACQSLEISALTQLIIKILYRKDKSIGINEINDEIRDFIGKRIETEKIDQALKELTSKISINKTQKKYKLRDSYRKKLKDQFDERDRRFNRVIDRYFTGAESKIENVKYWFNDVSIEYFCEFSNEWINEISKKEVRNHNKIHLEEVISKKEIFDINKIKKDDRLWLLEQYKKFLFSTEPDATALMWDYGNSLFSSKLIAANEYIDQSITEMLENSYLILDTNILMRIDLEKDRYSESYEALEDVFIQLNIEPIYLHYTKEEFNHAIDTKIQDIKRIREKYSYEVYSKLDDAFISSAIERKCSTDEHFEIFYEQITEIPKSIHRKLEIKELDNFELDSEINKGKTDSVLLDNLNEIYKKRNNRDKNEKNLMHDSGLIYGAKYLKNEKNTWIISRDGTLTEYARNHTIRDEIPLVISLDSLINLLAINDGFKGIVETNFIPLFANLVKSSIISTDSIFQIEDLLYMKDIESQINNLQDDQIVSIAKKVNKNRINGVSKEKIALELERDFQKAKLEISDELEDTRRKLNDKDQENEKVRKQYMLAKKGYFSEKEETLKRKYKNTFIKKIILFFTLFPLSVGLLLFVVRLIIPIETISNQLSLWLSLFIELFSTFITSRYFAIPSIFKDYQDKKLGINDEIEEQWNKYMVVNPT